MSFFVSSLRVLAICENPLIFDEASVEIDEACEPLELGKVFRGFPSVYSCHFDWVHSNSSMSDDKPQVFDF